jgi:hypothetical protein
MESCHILRVLNNGWEVPYPSEVIYRDMLFLKDYRLNDFPRDSSGNFDNDISYEWWLQKYLYSCQINLTAEQRRIFDILKNTNCLNCLYLGWIAGFYENCHALHPVYEFPENFEDYPTLEGLKGIVDDDPYQDFLDGLNEDEESIPSRLEYVLEDYGYFLLKREEEKRFMEYWPGFVKIEPLHWITGSVPKNVEPTDAAWRIYLSFILKSIPNETERIKQLDEFFAEYGDALHK